MTYDTATSLGFGTLQSVTELLQARADNPADRREPERYFATGMFPLDDVLRGGIRRRELLLIGGRPGAGKTVLALQWARAVAMQGAHAIYVCYEHTPEELLERLAALEKTAGGHESQRELAVSATSSTALFNESVGTYAHRLHFVATSGRNTDIAAIDGLVPAQDNRNTVVFVDYLQKVPTRGSVFASDDDRVGFLAEALKDFAMRRDVAVVAISGADKAALGKRRLRMHDLRGSSAVAYEADVVLMLNEKSQALSKTHLAFDTERAELAKRRLIVSVEKHRRGESDLHMEFVKDFRHHAVDPNGTFLTENLVDDVLFVE
jgi:replicative DNA helicase